MVVHSMCGRLVFDFYVEGKHTHAHISLHAPTRMHYHTRPGKKDAMVAKEIVNLIFDGEVEYPHVDVISALILGELIQEWMAKYEHVRCRADPRVARQAQDKRVEGETTMEFAPDVEYTAQDFGLCSCK
jgi:hypothetical protein